MINDIKDLPPLNDWPEEDNEKEKLIVFDDFINLDNKAKKKIHRCGWAQKINFGHSTPSIDKSVKEKFFLLFDSSRA